MLARFSGVCALVALMVIPGCGEPATQYDPAVAYTPESLASELSFRYNALPPSARDLAAIPKPKSTGPVEQRKNEVTKEAQVETLGTVLADIIAKSESITTPPPPAARAAMADRIEQDGTIATAHKQQIIAALRSAK